MEALFTSGRIVDLIIALMIIEGVVLFLYRRGTGRGIAPAALMINLAAGGSLLLALRAALAGASWPWIAACLLLSLLAHLGDLAQRWRR